MSNKRKGNGNWRGDDEELQAIVIADSFNRKFTPITQELPRALLPLGNKVLLDYTIEYLMEEGIQEIIIFCCSFGEKIREYVSNKWINPKRVEFKSKIHCVLSSATDCISLGDALREIDREGLIRSDFLLVPGDLVSNVKISDLVERHKTKRKKEKSLVMSVLYREVNPGHFTRCVEEDAFLAIDSESKKIVQYQKSYACRGFALSTSVLSTGREIDIHNNLSFTNIAICSPQVAPLFTDNFDYQTLDDFIKGILINEDIMGDQVHAYVIKKGYSNRVNDLHMYNAISLDLMSRWIYPTVPENSKCIYKRNNIYIEDNVRIEKNCNLEENVMLGFGTCLEEGVTINRSVIGINCKIGKNVTITNSYIWDNTVIEDNVSITQSIVCSNCIIKRSVKLIDSILSFNVCIDEEMKLDPETRLSLVKYISSEGDFEENDDCKNTNDKPEYNIDVVGKNGKGYLWPFIAAEEGLIPSLAGNDYESSSGEESSEDEYEDDLPPSPPAENNFFQFQLEVAENLRSGILENIAIDNIALEVNASKFKFNISIPELCETVAKVILQLTVKDGSPSKQEIINEFNKVVKFLHPLLLKYYNSAETQLNAVSAMADYFICLEESTANGLLATILHKLYDQDIIEESVILKWHKTVAADDRDKMKQLRENQSLIKLITWLEEAEEESDDD